MWQLLVWSIPPWLVICDKFCRVLPQSCVILSKILCDEFVDLARSCVMNSTWWDLAARHNQIESTAQNWHYLFSEYKVALQMVIVVKLIWSREDISQSHVEPIHPVSWKITPTELIQLDAFDKNSYDETVKRNEIVPRQKWLSNMENRLW